MTKRLYLAYTKADADWLITHSDELEDGIIVYSGAEPHLLFLANKIPAVDAVSFYRKLDFQQIYAEAEALHQKFEANLRTVLPHYGLALTYRNVDLLACCLNLFCYFFCETVTAYHLAREICADYNPDEIWVNPTPFTPVTLWGVAPPPRTNFENQVWGWIKTPTFVLKSLPSGEPGTAGTIAPPRRRMQEAPPSGGWLCDRHPGDLRADVLMALQGNFLTNYTPIGTALEAAFSLKTLNLNENTLHIGWDLRSPLGTLPALDGMDSVTQIGYELLEEDATLRQFAGDYPLDVWAVVRSRLHLLLTYDLPAVRDELEKAYWLLSRVSPKLLVMAEEVSIPARTLAAAARQFGIETLVIQHGAAVSSWGAAGDPRSGLLYWLRNYGETWPDYVAVWGDYGRRYYEESLAWSPERVLVTGWPWIEQHIGPYLSSQARESVPSVTTFRRVLFLSTATQKFHHVLYETLFMAAKALQAEFILRPHGAEDVSALRELAQAVGVEVTIDNQADLLEQIRQSDLVIGAATSVLSYAIALEKPCIFLDLLGIPDYLPYALEAAAIGVRQPEDLLPAIQTLLDPAVRQSQRDRQRTFTQAYLGTLDGQATQRITAFVSQKVAGAIAHTQQQRRQLAHHWLSIDDPATLATDYQGQEGKRQAALRLGGIHREPIAPEDLPLSAELLDHLAQAGDPAQYVKTFLAASLYYPIHQLPLCYTLAQIPDWFLADYLAELLAVPPDFVQVGESDRHYYHMRATVQAIHRAVFADQDPRFGEALLTHIIDRLVYLPLYFNELNLKELYTWRGDLLEAALKLGPTDLDYDFGLRPAYRPKLRLGILAAHFDASAETFSALPIYEFISREYEVILYSLQRSGSTIETYCRLCANAFQVLPADLGDQVEMIRQDDLDLLYFATNLTAVSNSITRLATHRLARIQITSVGSITTSGLRSIDYFLSGELSDPADDALAHYRETLVQLPGSVHCFSYGPHLEAETDLSVRREDLGISEDSTVFITGANYFKCIPELIHTWAQIIAAVPGSVWMALPFGPNWSNVYPKRDFTRWVAEIFAFYGVAGDRLYILDPQPVPTYETVKAYYAIADLCLDSYPVCGTTSLIEPLQLGIPVLTRTGPSLRGSMGAAMLEAMGLEGLVADSEADYIARAVALGTDSELRQIQRQQVKRQMRENPSILDSRRQGERMGQLFQQFVLTHSADALRQELRLRTLNLVLFPDWQSSEEGMLEELAVVIGTIADRPDRNQITLLLDTSGISSEEADLALSSIAMHLMMLDEAENFQALELALVDTLSLHHWEALWPQLRAWVRLAQENEDAIAAARARRYYSLTLDELGQPDVFQPLAANELHPTEG